MIWPAFVCSRSHAVRWQSGSISVPGPTAWHNCHHASACRAVSIGSSGCAFVYSPYLLSVSESTRLQEWITGLYCCLLINTDKYRRIEIQVLHTAQGYHGRKGHGCELHTKLHCWESQTNCEPVQADAWFKIVQARERLALCPIRT